MQWTDVVDIGDGTCIGPVSARTRLRGGGAAGASAWLAVVRGYDSRYGLDRDFLDANRSGLSGSGRSGHIDWYYEELEDERGPAILQYRSFATGCRSVASGFVLVCDGRVCEVPQRTVRALLDARWRSTGCIRRVEMLGAYVMPAASVPVPVPVDVCAAAGSGRGEDGFGSPLAAALGALLMGSLVLAGLPVYRAAIGRAQDSAAVQTANLVAGLVQEQAAGSVSGSLGAVSVGSLAAQDPRQRFSTSVASASSAVVNVVPDLQVAPAAVLVQVGSGMGGCVVAVVVAQGSSPWVGRGGISGPGTWWASSSSPCTMPVVGVLPALAYGTSPPLA